MELEREDDEDQVFTDEVEVPDFGEKNCCWTWSWCIGFRVSKKYPFTL